MNNTVWGIVCEMILINFMTQIEIIQSFKKKYEIKANRFSDSPGSALKTFAQTHQTAPFFGAPEVFAQEPLGLQAGLRGLALTKTLPETVGVGFQGHTG
jgi:hypothetical protein